jgi:hypothetical protein
VSEEDVFLGEGELFEFHGFPNGPLDIFQSSLIISGGNFTTVNSGKEGFWNEAFQWALLLVYPGIVLARRIPQLFGEQNAESVDLKNGLLIYHHGTHSESGI